MRSGVATCKYPQGDLNPCCRRERAASWASRRWGQDWSLTTVTELLVRCTTRLGCSAVEPGISLGLLPNRARLCHDGQLIGQRLLSKFLRQPRRGVKRLLLALRPQLGFEGAVTIRSAKLRGLSGSVEGVPGWDFWSLRIRFVDCGTFGPVAGSISVAVAAMWCGPGWVFVF